jgi:hypothetical protein
MTPQILNAQQATQQLRANNYDINSLMAGWVDRGKWVYYDTMTVAKGTAVPATYTFFQIGLGGIDAITGLVKNKVQTNIPGSGGFFTPPRCLILDQIGFLFTGPPSTSAAVFSQTQLVDIAMFINSCYFEMTIDSKIFFEGNLLFHPPGYGIYGSSTDNTESAWGAGFPSPSATYRFGNYGKYIAPLQAFAVKITFPGATLPLTNANGVGVNLQCLLKGLTDRSVQ